MPVVKCSFLLKFNLNYINVIVHEKGITLQPAKGSLPPKPGHYPVLIDNTSYVYSKISSPTATKPTKANLAFSFPPAPVNGLLVGVIFTVPTAVPLLDPPGTLGVVLGVATTCPTTVAVPKFRSAVQFG